MENDAKKTSRAQTYQNIMQFIKFNCVGVLNTIVDFVVYSMMCMLGLHYLLAQVIGYAFGVGNSYMLNSLWTFARERRHTADEFGRFLLVNLVSLSVSLGVLWVCRNPLGIESDLWCKAVATPVALIVNFTGNKLFVFKKAQEPAEKAGEREEGNEAAAGTAEAEESE